MAGIIGYGVYIPLHRIKTYEIAKIWGRDSDGSKKGLMMAERTVPDADEDTVTMSVESSLNAIKRARINPKEIGAIYSGSESPAYAVKPNVNMIANSIGMGNKYSGADVEFACKAGTAAIQIILGLVKSNTIKYGLAIGADIAEYNAENVTDQGGGAGSGAFIVGNNKNEEIAEIKDTVSYSSDIPDFWRRPKMRYPTHAERFTGEPAYFKHTVIATKMILEKIGLKPSDINHVAFHTPNEKFPKRVAKFLGFTNEQLKNGFVVDRIGNTFSAAPLIGLASILDNAKPGDKIILTSFGSGAGSDAFYIEVTDKIEEKRILAKTTLNYLEKKKYIDYTSYLKLTGRIV